MCHSNAYAGDVTHSITISILTTESIPNIFAMNWGLSDSHAEVMAAVTAVACLQSEQFGQAVF